MAFNIYWKAKNNQYLKPVSKNHVFCLSKYFVARSKTPYEISSTSIRQRFEMINSLIIIHFTSFKMSQCSLTISAIVSNCFELNSNGFHWTFFHLWIQWGAFFSICARSIFVLVHFSLIKTSIVPPYQSINQIDTIALIEPFALNKANFQRIWLVY